ncbi:guanine-1-methyltransferase-domain-containing protein [Auriculariales sp. MPI-PUGE-AT-0066]|nr:guanine-1-methyltransferase-domain-containing protein [Auriculariales sp. MPI-PUGE-AT-0066]
MSKSRVKKLARQERLKSQHAERKAAKKAQRADIKAKRDAGELPPDALPPRKKRKTGPPGKPTPFNARVVIDLGFDDLMSEKECVSLTSQLAYSFSANRRSLNPISHLLFTSLNGKTFTRLESLANAAYKRWARTEWWTEPLEHLWTDDAPDAEPRKTRAAKETVVYLTGDAEDDIMELKEGETYIIGGLCDHNRYKAYCYKKAQSLGIRTARLPIGKFVANMPTRKILTVNQCYDILLKWLEHRDWERAFYAVIPARKFNKEDQATEPEVEEDVEVHVDVEDLAAEEDDSGNEEEKKK